MGLSNTETYFTGIYNDTYKQLLKYLLIRCKNSNEISDLLQNVYTKFYERLNKYGRFHFINAKRYLYRIARDELALYYKNHDNQSRIFSYDETEDEVLVPAESTAAENLAIDACLLDETWSLINEKGTTVVKIYTLYFVYDYTLSKIAKELDLPESTVKNKLYRTLHEIKQRYTGGI